MLEDTLLLARPCAAFLIAMRIFPHLVFLCVPVSCFSASILGVRTRPPPRSHRIPHPPLSYRSPHRPDRASHPRLPRPRCASRRCCRPGPRSCSLRPGRAAHTPRAATGPAAQPQTGQTQPRRAAPRSPPRTLGSPGDGATWDGWIETRVCEYVALMEQAKRARACHAVKSRP